jgi:F-type H+-transporting ATPase subunit delta
VHGVTIPGSQGVMGVLADHVPMIAQLKPGVVLVHGSDLSDVTHRYVVYGGFAIVTAQSTAHIAAVEAFKVDDLDLHAAKDRLAQANATLNKAADERAKAEAQIEIDTYEAIVYALENK